MPERKISNDGRIKAGTAPRKQLTLPWTLNTSSTIFFRNEFPKAEIARKKKGEKA